MQNFINYFQIEKFNIILALTGLVVTFLTMLTAKVQIKTKQRNYYILSIIYIVSFLVVIFVKSWLIFMIAWEMITISTALMLLWKNKGLTGQYLLIQFLGSSILMCFILLAYRYGYHQIMPVSEIWLQNLFILGLGMKSAIFGLHFWLPAVHSQAPAPVSAILSAWVVKLGYITYLRIIPEGNLFLLILGFLMVFHGGKKALLSSDYKVLLAYSSISQLGYIAIGIGSGTILGILGSVLHIIAHSFAKTSLFIGSACLLRSYESRSIYDFKGVLERPTIINLSILTSFGSLMGIPLLAGFNSKYLIKHSLFAEQAFNVKGLMPLWLTSLFNIKKLEFLGLAGEQIIIIAIYAAGLLTSLYSIRFLYWGFFKGLGNRVLGRNINNNHSNENTKIEDDNRNKKGYAGEENSKFSLDKAEIFVLSITIVLLLAIPFYSIDLLNMIKDIDLHFDYFNGLIEFIIIWVIAVIILYRAKWYKISEGHLPSLDFLFNGINKSLHRTARFLYNIVYYDFQYQLLWIPIFLIILFLWASL